MPQSVTAFDAVLKEDYHAPIVEQLNNSNMFVANIGKNTEDFQGKHFVQPLHVARNGGVGARAEGDTLPTAGQQGYVDIIGPVRQQTATIQLSTLVMRASKNDKGSFIRALDAEQKGVVKDAARDYCRQSWGTSNGVIATCGTTTASTTVVLAASTGVNQMRWLADLTGARIDIGTVATPSSVSAGNTIVSVNISAKTLVVSSAVTTSAANFIFRQGAGGASNNSGNFGDGQRELTGIQSHVASSGILHKVDPTTYPLWAANVTAIGGAITENALVKALMDTEVVSGETVDMVVASPGVFRSISNLFATNKRFVSEPTDLKGGHRALTIDSVLAGGSSSKQQTLSWTRDAPDQTVWGFATEAFREFVLQDWDWMDDDGAVLSRVSGQTAYGATLEKFSEIVCNQRNANFVLTGITES